MNILLVTSQSPFHELTGAVAAGAEIAMRCLAQALAQRGHNVHFLSLSNTRNKTTLIDGIHVHIRSQAEADRSIDIRDLAFIRRLVSRIRQYLREIPRLRRWLPKAWRQAIDRWTRHATWGFRRNIEAVVAQHDIELIHSFSSTPDSFAAALVARQFNLPLVIRMGGRHWYLEYQDISDENERAEYLGNVRMAFETSDCLAYNATTLRDETQKLLEDLQICSPVNQPVLDIGIHVPRLRLVDRQPAAIPAFNEHLSTNELRVLCVGKFKAGSKRQDLLIQALARMQQVRDVRLFFAGDGALEPTAKALAAELGVGHRVSFLGSVPHDQIFWLMRKVDIIAHPTEFEGSSKAIAEAMFCKRPIIASDIPALREQLRHEHTGLLVANTAEAFAMAIDRLASDAELRDRLGTNAREFAESTFNPDRNIRHYVKLFDKLITKRRSNSFRHRLVRRIARSSF